MLSNLPDRLTSFIGREIAEIKDLLPDTRLLTLAGAGGCGKRRLALEVLAHRWETELLQDRRLLVVGAGGIGRAIARLGRAAGMRVGAVARMGRADPELGWITAVADLNRVLGDADYVVIAAPLTPETRGLFSAAAFERMKPTARLINIGRGAIVNEKALANALRHRRISGAALDVFMHEPLPREHPFWDLPGLVVSPHMSGDFVGWAAAVADLFIENYRRWRRGDPLLNVVDKTLGYVASADARPASPRNDIS